MCKVLSIGDHDEDYIWLMFNKVYSLCRLFLYRYFLSGVEYCITLPYIYTIQNLVAVHIHWCTSNMELTRIEIIIQ